MLIPPELPTAVSSTVLKIPLLKPPESSSSAEIVLEASMVTAPASPCPKVLALTTPPPRSELGQL